MPEEPYLFALFVAFISSFSRYISSSMSFFQGSPPRVRGLLEQTKRAPIGAEVVRRPASTAGRPSSTGADALSNHNIARPSENVNNSPLGIIPAGAGSILTGFKKIEEATSERGEGFDSSAPTVRTPTQTRRAEAVASSKINIAQSSENVNANPLVHSDSNAPVKPAREERGNIPAGAGPTSSGSL